MQRPTSALTKTMICEVCQTENATVHLTQIISGKMQKIDLCEKCAKEKGVADPAGFSLADMLLGLGAADEIKSNGTEELVCPQCGFTQPDFKKTGRLGCPQCYVTFSEGLGVILKDMHKGILPQGQNPEPCRPRPGIPEPAQDPARQPAKRRAVGELRAGGVLARPDHHSGNAAQELGSRRQQRCSRINSSSWLHRRCGSFRSVRGSI